MIDKTPLVMRNLASDPELRGTCCRNRRRTGRAQPGPSFLNFMPMAGVGDARAADELCRPAYVSPLRTSGTRDLDQHPQDLDRLNAINLVISNSTRKSSASTLPTGHAVVAARTAGRGRVEFPRARPETEPMQQLAHQIPIDDHARCTTGPKGHTCRRGLTLKSRYTTRTAARYR
jgi:hypothetical protein